MHKIEAVYSSLLSVDELDERLKASRTIELPVLDRSNTIILSVVFTETEPLFRGATEDGTEVMITRGTLSAHAAAHPTVIITSSQPLGS